MGSNTTLSIIRKLAAQASNAIMAIYSGSDSFDYTIKADQQDSPLTQADLAAHRILVAGLNSAFPEIPVISEEDTSNHHLISTTKRYWLVDPLDGTKEFIKRNGEFTVNIGLIEAGAPTLGVVQVPATNTSYFGGAGLGAFKQVKTGPEKTIRVAQPNSNRPTRIAVSRSHLSEQDQAFINKHTTHLLIQSGSSLKFCLVAEGSADVYPRFNPLNQWDFAAADAVLRAAGGAIFDVQTNQPYSYGATMLLPKLIAKPIA